MKKLSCYIGLLMATLWLSACKSDTPLEPDTTVGDGEQVLEITVDGDFYASSRSTAASAGYKLVSSQAIQHIEHLYAYIFNGSDRDATCVYVTEIPWEQNSQQGSASLTYRLKEANLLQYGKSDMQVLVVAVDNNTDTYYFPYEGVANHADDTNNQEGNTIIGQPLSGVKMKLAEAAAGTTISEADKAFKMANTEVFSGLASFKADDQIIKVSLQRCVAGVLCYLTDIPYYVGSGTDDVNKISSIELQLGNNLNLNLNTEYASFYDGTKFGSVSSDNSESSDNKVIASVNILEYIYGTTSGTLNVQPEDASLTEKNTHRLYVPAMDNGAVKTKENTILFGAYLLPIENNAAPNDKTKATLKLVLKANNEVQQTAFIVKNTVISEPAYAYSLKANRLYSIGSKPFATDTDADQPASLKGKEILLTVNTWKTPEGGNVNFPVYSLKSTISADWDIQYENYIFNCMSETRTVYIYPSKEEAQSLNFKVQVAYSDEFKNNPWVKFRFIDESGKPFDGYDDWYTTIDIDNIPEGLYGKTRMALEVRLNDYVEKKYILGNSLIPDKKDALLKDYRTATLQLVNSSNAEVLSSVPIRQFNAITIKFDYENKGIQTTGFSRLDFGATMGDNGIAKGSGNKIPWGFSNGTNPWHIFGGSYSSHLDGNYNGEQDGDWACDYKWYGYDDSALFKCRKAAEGLDKNWYLPAREELKAFMSQASGLLGILNIQENLYYWTCSSVAGKWKNAYSIYSTDASVSTQQRSNSFYCRQAIKFPN